MKYFFLFAILACSHVSVTAQTVHGLVHDATTNTPLAGASIKFSGKGGTTTDKAGYFSFSCQNISSLTVSHIGYETVLVNISCDQDLVIALTPSGQHMNDVEITATSSPTKSLLYQPASITKLSLLELKRGTSLFLDDAINGNVPGVSMQRRSVSGGQQFNIRGYGNGSRGTRGISSNFDGQGYKVYLNGIPVTDAEGITTLDDIDYGSIGNVEVTKGPAGTLYGLAIAGAVNLKTVKPEKGKTQIGQEAILGNYGLQRYTTTLQMGLDRSSLLLNYGHQQSDGFANHNKSRKDFVNLAGDFQPNEKQGITAYIGYSNSYDERLGELTLAQYDANDYSGNIEYIKRDAHSNVVTFRGGLGHTYHFTRNIANTTTLFGTGFTSNASSAGGWTDKNTINYGLRSYFDTRFRIGKSSLLSGITGIETQRQNGQTNGFSMKADPSDPTPATWTYGEPYWVVNAATSNTATITGTTSLFTEWTLALPQDFSVTAGIGMSNMKITLDDRFNAATATKPSHYDTTYKAMVSPHIALNKVFSKQFSAYVSYSKAYKAPVSSYFFITTPATTAPNPVNPATGRINSVLKPEVGNQFEIGGKGALKSRLYYELAFFYIAFTDKMTAVAVPLNNTTTAYSYMVNGGSQDHKGIEALVKYTAYMSADGFFSSVTPFVNFAYADFRYKDFKFQSGTTAANISTVDYSHKAVAGVPEKTINWGFDIFTHPGIYLNFIHNYRDGFPITSDGANRTGSYNLLNAKLGLQRPLTARFSLNAYLGVNNITGTKYPLMVFVNQLPDAYIPAPPKAVIFGGIHLKYQLNK